MYVVVIVIECGIFIYACRSPNSSKLQHSCRRTGIISMPMGRARDHFNQSMTLIYIICGRSYIIYLCYCRFIVHKMQQGEIDGLTMVRDDTADNWKELMNVPELKEASVKAAREEEAAHAVMNMVPTESEVAEGGDALDAHFSQLVGGVGGGDEGEGGKCFVADDGVRYKWDKEENGWVEDDEPAESDNEENGCADKASSRPLRGGHVPDEDEGEDEGEGEGAGEGGEEGPKRKRKKRKKKGNQEWNASASKMWVYIAGLPLDVTVDELKAHFSKVRGGEGSLDSGTCNII